MPPVGGKDITTASSGFVFCHISCTKIVQEKRQPGFARTNEQLKQMLGGRFAQRREK